MARYFYDCEFIEDGRTIDLVSIGMVAQDGREYYAISTEFDPRAAGQWVRRHVIDKLPGPADAAWKSRSTIRQELAEFLTAPGLPIQLWAWNAPYDHVVLAQLWGAMPALPPEIPRLTREIRQHWEAAGCPPIPDPGRDRHHALADARLGRDRWLVAERILSGGRAEHRRAGARNERRPEEGSDPGANNVVERRASGASQGRSEGRA